MKAYFVAEFKPEEIIDKESLQSEYDGSWDTCIDELYREEGIGIFEELVFSHVEK